MLQAIADRERENHGCPNLAGESSDDDCSEDQGPISPRIRSFQSALDERDGFFRKLSAVSDDNHTSYAKGNTRSSLPVKLQESVTADLHPAEGYRKMYRLRTLRYEYLKQVQLDSAYQNYYVNKCNKTHESQKYSRRRYEEFRNSENILFDARYASAIGFDTEQPSLEVRTVCPYELR